MCRQYVQKKTCLRISTQLSSWVSFYTLVPRPFPSPSRNSSLKTPKSPGPPGGRWARRGARSHLSVPRGGEAWSERADFWLLPCDELKPTVEVAGNGKNATVAAVRKEIHSGVWVKHTWVKSKQQRPRPRLHPPLLHGRSEGRRCPGDTHCTCRSLAPLNRS